MFRTLSEKEFEKIYLTDVHRDFPESEIKPWEVVNMLYSTGRYEPIGCFEGDALKAYALMIIPGEGKSPLLDFLSVIPQYRNSGIGSIVLRGLQEYYKAQYGEIMIECEHPSEAPDKAVAIRRLSFYDRAGAVLTDTQTRLFGVLFLIYRLPCCDVTPGDDVTAMENIYRVSVPADKYDNAVEIFHAEYTR